MIVVVVSGRPVEMRGYIDPDLDRVATGEDGTDARPGGHLRRNAVLYAALDS